MKSPSPLQHHLSSYTSVVVGYSGGVDSALVAVVANRVLGQANATAVLGVSPAVAAVQLEQARSVARQFGLSFVELGTSELDDPRYVANATNRCYYCKHELWSRLADFAKARGIEAILDGTNADDVRGHRPGLAAAPEHGVRSPLAEAGYTKAMVREEARALGIPIWDAPASPCLSSRIVYGLPVTRERLRQVEGGEAWLRAMGVKGNLRVRHLGSGARIEVDPEMIASVRSRRRDIETAFRALGFSCIDIDAGGYRSGSLLSSESVQRDRPVRGR